MSEILLNPSCRPVEQPGESADTMRFHSRLPEYQPSPLRDCPAIARRAGIGRVLLKDETRRIGLPSFKILGASWALYRRIERKLGITLDDWESFEELRTRAIPALRGVRLVCATDGNHGRAVARLGRLLGMPVRVFVPRVTAEARIDAIGGEDAEVVVAPGPYDHAIAMARSDAEPPDAWLIQDNSWVGYEQIPAWVQQGYSTMLAEIDQQYDGPFDILSVPIGVGTFAAGVVRHFRSARRPHRPIIIGIEPTTAACATEAIRAGRIVTLDGEPASIMAGLNCGTVASLALPAMRDGIDAFVTIDDGRAINAMRLLAEQGIECGESGAASLAGMLDLADSSRWGEIRESLGIPSDPAALAFVTEGVTDPAGWTREVGRRPIQGG